MAAPHDRGPVRPRQRPPGDPKAPRDGGGPAERQGARGASRGNAPARAGGLRAGAGVGLRSSNVSTSSSSQVCIANLSTLTVPAIHVFPVPSGSQGVDARLKAGHDGENGAKTWMPGSRPGMTGWVVMAGPVPAIHAYPGPRLLAPADTGARSRLQDGCRCRPVL